MWQENRNELEAAAERLRPDVDAVQIRASGTRGAFLVANSAGRGFELYRSDEHTVTLDPAIGDELQGEIDFASFDKAIAAGLDWLRRT